MLYDIVFQKWNGFEAQRASNLDPVLSLFNRCDLDDRDSVES